MRSSKGAKWQGTKEERKVQEGPQATVSNFVNCNYSYEINFPSFYEIMFSSYLCDNDTLDMIMSSITCKIFWVLVIFWDAQFFS